MFKIYARRRRRQRHVRIPFQQILYSVLPSPSSTTTPPTPPPPHHHHHPAPIIPIESVQRREIEFYLYVGYSTARVHFTACS